jgi:hypothetical protein
MKLVVLAIALVACGKDYSGDVDAPAGGLDGPNTSPDAPPGCTSGAQTTVMGHITADTTWSDKINVPTTVIIDAGVTVTVMPGTTINFAPYPVDITLNGHLDIEGSSACKVTLQPAHAGDSWAGILAESGSVLTMHHAVQVGGGIRTAGTANVTILDSAMNHALGDWLVMSGGTVDVEYSSFGLEPGQADTTHCDMHLNSGFGNVVTITHSNVGTSVYGLMFYGGTNASFTYNNWFQNGIDVHTEVGAPVSGDFSNGWFEKGAPVAASGSVFTLNNLATARLTDTGPRP